MTAAQDGLGAGAHPADAINSNVICNFVLMQNLHEQTYNRRMTALERDSLQGHLKGCPTCQYILAGRRRAA